MLKTRKTPPSFVLKTRKTPTSFVLYCNGKREFHQLTRDEKIHLLIDLGYRVDGDFVISGKDVSISFSSMFDSFRWGYDHILVNQYIHDTLCIQPIKEYDIYRKSHKEYCKNDKIIGLSAKYACILAPQPYRIEKDDNHGCGWWAQKCHYYGDEGEHGKKKNIPRENKGRFIEVMYNINDPTLSVVLDGHLKCKNTIVSRLNPSWKYNPYC